MNLHIPEPDDDKEDKSGLALSLLGIAYVKSDEFKLRGKQIDEEGRDQDE